MQTQAAGAALMLAAHVADYQAYWGQVKEAAGCNTTADPSALLANRSVPPDVRKMLLTRSWNDAPSFHMRWLPAPHALLSFFFAHFFSLPPAGTQVQACDTGGKF